MLAAGAGPIRNNGNNIENSSFRFRLWETQSEFEFEIVYVAAVLGRLTTEDRNK